MNILIVDDDMATVTAICDSVDWERLGIRKVERAYNIAMAKPVLEKVEIDIVVCDIEMPMGSGIELLRWIRENRIACEFLFLTCHEDFRYATAAIQYEAAGYLVKPFNITRMELELIRVIRKIEDKRQLQRDSDYGRWMAKNREKVMNDFWQELLFRKMGSDRESLRRELEIRHLELNLDRQYRAVGVKVGSLEEAAGELGRDLLEFACERFIGEALEEELVNESVIRWRIQEVFYYVVIDRTGKSQEELFDRCDRLIASAGRALKCQFTCCVGTPCTLEKLPEAVDSMISAMEKHMLFSERSVLEEELQARPHSSEKILDLKQMEEFLLQHNKMMILNTVTGILDRLTEQKMIHADLLFGLEQEILQLVYTYLYRNGIQATELFSDAISQKLQKQAVNSVFDMVKWINYVCSRTLDYENEVKRSLSIVEKVEKYIHEHYWENISREEIASSVFLAPEYLAKLYKKKAGRTVKDYLNQYRIQQAKKLLKNSGQNISDVAGMVGFDNFSYFSTIFKKYEGMSPGEYRKSLS